MEITPLGFLFVHKPDVIHYLHFLLKMYHNADTFFAVLNGNVSLNRMTHLKKDTSKRFFALDVSML